MSSPSFLIASGTCNTAVVNDQNVIASIVDSRSDSLKYLQINMWEESE